MNTFGDQLSRIRRNWWIVAVLAVVGLAAGVGASLLQHTTYTGRAALIVSSNGRSPDQDAVLVQGYVDYFNADGYQREILAEAGVPAGIKVTAKTAAASPIMLVEATAGDATTAGQAATRVAQGFRTNMNATRDSGTAEAADAVKAQLAQAQAAAAADPSAAAAAEISSLQNQLHSLQSDQTNKLQLLQPDGGVAKAGPPLVRNALFGFVGGILTGCLAALAFAAKRNRLVTATEIAEVTGLDILAKVPDGSADDPERRRILRRLAAVIATAGLPERSVIAVMAPAGRGTAARLSRDLCEVLRSAGGQVQFVRACDAGEVTDLHGDSGGRASGDLGRMQLLGVAGTAGRGAVDIGKRVERLRASENLTVIDASTAEDAASASALCVAVDTVLVVVELDEARAVNLEESTNLLRQMGVPILGAISVASDPGLNRRQVRSWLSGLRFRREQRVSTTGDRASQASTATESA
ncbi:hypothetical protein [Tomitella fengzijianii]|uniref:Chain length determinant protein n=2 Tax=Tomitella fengzijianii TaxID=2597660 RepID=A0A516X0P7_9ACTN|nr:hypothetical protein [Tomitella fengzijianii]QDQ96664.1 hypothetical protein FO059_04020 [Tomitella fengzijianii]